MKAQIWFLTLLMVTAAIAQPPETLWTRTYGWSIGTMAYSCQQTCDGGFIIAGYTNVEPGSNNDMFVVKTDDTGDTLWTRRYGWEHNDYCYDIHQLSDGGYILGGIGNLDYNVNPWVSEYCLIRIDNNGDTLWTRLYRKAEVNEAYDVGPCEDGGFILVGYARGTGTGWYDIYIVRTDEFGDTLWTRTVDESDYDVAYSVEQTTDGGYIVAGNRSLNPGVDDYMYLIKLNADGDTLWTRTYTEIGNSMALCVQQTVDEGYILVGDGNGDCALIKTDSEGNILWTHTYGGDESEEAFSVRQTSDGGYILGGQTSSFGMGEDDFYLVRTDSLGDTLWTNTYGGFGHDYCRSIEVTQDGGYIAVGRGEFGNGSMYAVRLRSDMPSVAPRGNTIGIPNSFLLHPPYPNPFNPITNITFEVPCTGNTSLAIYNLLGHRVTTLFNQKINPGLFSVIWDAGVLPSGVYLCRLEAGNCSQTRKLLLLK